LTLKETFRLFNRYDLPTAQKTLSLRFLVVSRACKISNNQLFYLFSSTESKPAKKDKDKGKEKEKDKKDKPKKKK